MEDIIEGLYTNWTRAIVKEELAAAAARRLVRVQICPIKHNLPTLRLQLDVSRPRVVVDVQTNRVRCVSIRRYTIVRRAELGTSYIDRIAAL